MRLFGALCLAGAVVACSSHSGVEGAGVSAQAIIKGTASDTTQDAVVLIAHIEPSQPFALGECTATMLAPNVILTARHCVAQTNDAGFTCTEKGVGSSGGAVTRDHKADSLYVFPGTTPRPSPNPQAAKARGKQIFSDGGKNLCNHDLAVVVLDKAIEGAPIAPVRLDTPPVKGATFTAVGWGLVQNSTLPAVRQQRAGIAIQNVGPFADPGSLIAVPDHEFQVGEGICQGDSGGPALDSDTGAVIGVVSRGGNGVNDPARPAAGCVGTDTQNYYSHTTAYKDLILQAFEAAGAEIWVEGQPDPRLAKFGEACDGDAACRSNVCLADKKTCSQTCDDAATKCPDGFVCTARGGAKICTVKPPPAVTQTTTSGCAITRAGGERAPTVLGFAALAAATLVRRRRNARA